MLISEWGHGRVNAALSWALQACAERGSRGRHAFVPWFAKRSSLGVLAVVLSLLGSVCVAQTTIKIATVAPEGSAWMTQMRAAAAQSSAATEGRVQFKFYPGGVMGNDSAVLRKIRLGQLQGGAFTGSEAGAIFSTAQLYSLPFLFRHANEVDAVRAVMDAELAAAFSANGFQALSITGVGFAMLMSKHDVAGREALRQRKVWVPHNDVIAERTFRGGEISPIPLPLPDVFTALQTGLIDTVGNTPAGAVALQWHGSLRQVLDLPLSYITGYVVVDARSWGRLTEADRGLVLQAFADKGRLIDQGNRKADAQALEALQSMGVKLVQPDASEVARWEAVGARVVDQLVGEGRLDGAMVAKVRALLTEQRAGSAP